MVAENAMQAGLKRALNTLQNKAFRASDERSATTR